MRLYFLMNCDTTGNVIVWSPTPEKNVFHMKAWLKHHFKMRNSLQNAQVACFSFQGPKTQQKNEQTSQTNWCECNIIRPGLEEGIFQVSFFKRKMEEMYENRKNSRLDPQKNWIKMFKLETGAFLLEYKYFFLGIRINIAK